MAKYCLIHSFRPSAWVSCQQIVANLLKAYQALPGEFVHVHYGEDMDEYEYTRAFQLVVEASPTHVVFLDHNPHPGALMEPLMGALKERGLNPVFHFHVYGDFTLTFNEWKRTEKLLQGRPVRWFVASERQAALMGEFLPRESLEVCPFPVDPKEFHPDDGLRAKGRATHGWREGERVYLFTGRLSRQKRIHQLIPAFTRWRQESGADARLVLVGEPDKVGEPFLQQHEHEGEYFHRLLALWEGLPSEERSRVEFHGFRPNRELNAYYNAADCLVNLSVHNDEDYGMSCAEALAAGLPLILTDWAGFPSFRRPGLEDEVRLIPARITRGGKQVDTGAFRRALAERQSRPVPERHRIAELSLAHTSIARVTKVLAEGEPAAFTGWLPRLHQAAAMERYQNWCTFFDLRKKRFNDLYMQLYRHYVG